jgi:hypothetical protein
MAELKYKVLPKGAADGRIPINLIYIDKADVARAGILMKDACTIVAKDFHDAASIDVIDTSAITVTSDGIVADCAVVAFASVDNGKIDREFGFIGVSEIPYTRKLIEEEPHMRQWDLLHSGKRLYRGPSYEDMIPRAAFNETQTYTGRIANNNTGSEVMDVIDMTEILTPIFGLQQIMADGEVTIGVAGPEISVGIGMVVRERQGRIFNWAYGAGMTAHASGIFAKTVKSDYAAIMAPKPVLAQKIIEALEIGMIPGRDISCSPANLCVAKALGYPIDLGNIAENAWVELESIGITRAWLEQESEKLTKEQVLADADRIIPGIVDPKTYKVSDISVIRYASYEKDE